MELRLEPTILKTLTGANPKLQFLNECLSYSCDERPTVTIMSRRLNQLSMESECLFRMPKTQRVINFSIVLYFKQQIMQVWTSLYGYCPRTKVLKTPNFNIHKIVRILQFYETGKRCPCSGTRSRRASCFRVAGLWRHRCNGIRILSSDSKLNGTSNKWGTSWKGSRRWWSG